MPTASPLAANGLLYVGTGSQADGESSVRRHQAGRRRRHHAQPAATTSNDFIAWRQPRASGYTPSALVHDGRAYLVHDTGILAVLNATSGQELYKVRVGGGGHTFSASPVAAGNRVFLLDEGGMTFVIEAADQYKEIAQNDLAEMSLASPAIAAGAIYIRDRDEALQESAGDAEADLLGTQRDDRIDVHRAACGDPARDERHGRQYGW